MQKSLCCSANSHLKTVALSGISGSSQIDRRLSPSAMRLQIALPSSVVNRDGCPKGRFRSFMGLDQFDKGAHLAPLPRVGKDAMEQRFRRIRALSLDHEGGRHSKPFETKSHWFILSHRSFPS